MTYKWPSAPTLIMSHHTCISINKMICRINDHPNELYCHTYHHSGCGLTCARISPIIDKELEISGLWEKQQHVTCKLLAFQFTSLSQNRFPFTCHVISLQQTTFFCPPVCSLLPGVDQDIQLRSEEPGNWIIGFVGSVGDACLGHPNDLYGGFFRQQRVRSLVTI